MSVLEPLVECHVEPDDLRAALRGDVREGLEANPKELPPKWFYDERGSELFDEITRLEEYYPTEAEREILLREAGTIAELTRADTLVELGSGTSDKTRAMLDAFWERGWIDRFIALEVSEAVLRSASHALSRRYPGLEVHGVVGDFDHHLGKLPSGGRRLIVLLGGTIGNYKPAERQVFLRQLAAEMKPGDHLLLGTDLVKSQERLVTAYDDASGVTAAFNKNVLAVINRELGADFDLDAFEHVAYWDAEQEWIEMQLRSRTQQKVRMEGLDLEVEFAEGETMRTEVSAKFRELGIREELARAGLERVAWWTDADGDFGVSLAART